MMKNDRIQILRAVAIIGVVIIHTTSPGMSQVIYRPFVNYAVGLFLFLSGYLTKIDNKDWLSFYKRRIIRVFIPYIVWSCLYTWEQGNFSLMILARNLLLTGACFTFYYIFVYIQFVLLTPLIGQLARSKYTFLGLLIAPLAIILFQLYSTLGSVHDYIALVYNLSFLGWFSFYYLGILLGNGLLKVNYSITRLSYVYLLTLVIQMLEGYAWFLKGDTNCGTQLKVSSILTTCIALLIAYQYLNSKHFSVSNKILLLIGKYSFGIYLSHIGIIHFLRYISPSYSDLPYLINSALVLSLSLIFVAFCSKLLGTKMSKWLGLC